MKFQIDHDYHIHSQLSLCSKDPEQTPLRMLEYASENGLKKLCLTDHFWDDTVKGASDWYTPQNFNHISKVLPLPEKDGIEFCFGCETDLDKNLTLGISKSTIEKFDFVIIPTTHLHMKNFTIGENATDKERSDAFIHRLEGVLNMDLPFRKIGIAHLACGLIVPGGEIERVLRHISDDDLQILFKKAAARGVGIEINYDDFKFDKKTTDTIEQILRIFGIAKDMGCKFYLGSDAHHPDTFAKTHAVFEKAIELLDLSEDDKFTF